MGISVEEFFDKCKSLRVLVVGDLMVDRYLWGKVSRISPEAPVPIVDINQEENRLGGAANVALNVHAMGAQPILCGLVGADRDGVIFRHLAEELAFDSDLILPSEKRRTTVKVRVIGNQQQVLRVDREDTFPLLELEQQALLPLLIQKIPESDLIILEDYDKGLFSPNFIRQIVQQAQQQQVPIFVDPKFRNFLSYEGVTLFKPNLKELNGGLKLQLAKKDHQAIGDAILSLRKQMSHHLSLITLSEEGMILIDEKEAFHHFPAHYRDIVDVSGAGDTVITVASLALAAGLDPTESIILANLAGGLVCEEVGVVPINVERLKGEFFHLGNSNVK